MIEAWPFPLGKGGFTPDAKEERMTCCTCVKCGWVSVAVTRVHAEQEVLEFNTYYDSLPLQEQNDYYGGRNSSIKDYEQCHCGGTEFRPAKDGDCPRGVTLSPVIYEQERMC